METLHRSATAAIKTAKTTCRNNRRTSFAYSVEGLFYASTFKPEFIGAVILAEFRFLA